MAEVGADIGRVRIRLPSKISKGEVIRVRALVTHPMEVPSFDKERKPIPKNYQFVYKIVVAYNGKEILQAETTQTVSQNPFIAFPLKVTEPGKLVIIFTDTHGKKYEGSAEIKF
ncbi:MAG TPA: thiosulfate oxidation carrier complex protein SoxZ [Candidatus Binatia bacterium]|nr:thiosulfate oxidation carrier complex protein SoxZ [Candidatus Binatia bacterium]